MCECSLTENKDSVAKRLSTIWLHCNIQHGGISPNDADTIVLLCLSEHPQQLIGYDPVQHRYGHHGYQKGQECVYLFREERERQDKRWNSDEGSGERYHYLRISFKIVFSINGSQYNCYGFSKNTIDVCAN